MTWRGRVREGWRRFPKLAVLLAVANLVGTYAASPGQSERAPVDAVAVGLLLLVPAGLVVRRRWPVPALIWVLVLTLTYLVLEYPHGPVVIAPLVALVTAIRYGHRLSAWLGAVGMVAGFFGLSYLLGVGDPPTPIRILVVAGWTVVALVAGEAFRAHARWTWESRRASQAEEVGRLTEERLRIARELHDVLAHNISLINVQAGVALHLMEAQPEQARTSLTAIKQASKEALVELRSVLGVLRKVDEPDPRQPAPGLARLDDLVERTRGAGLSVVVDVEGEPARLPPAVDVAVFRILQEALTNVLRHSGARTVEVRLAYHPAGVTVDVTDDGHGPDPEAAETGGSGLVGMGERARSVGGELTSGPAADGGFHVHVELPLAPPPASILPSEPVGEER